jgi:hypothetical protein
VERFIKGPAAIGPFPTTWFVDREGKIAFVHEGASEEMYEEFVWRVEMLRGPRSSAAATAQQQSGASAAPVPVAPDRPELVKEGILPPHDQLPMLTRDLSLTSEQRAAVDAIRARYRPRYEALYQQHLAGTEPGPGKLFAIRDTEAAERKEALEVLGAEQRRRFEEAVEAMSQKRRGMIRVAPR